MLALANLKEQTGSNKHLLGADPTQAGSRTIGGVPPYVSPSVADDVVWGISKPHSIFVLRQDASVVTDTSVYFTLNRVAVRATLRVSFGFTYPAAVVKVNITP